MCMEYVLEATKNKEFEASFGIDSDIYEIINSGMSMKKVDATNKKALGNHIVVQGGTFYNNAVLRSFEKIANCQAIRPDIAGIMGAFGAALIARENYEEGYKTSMLSLEQINSLIFETSMAKCKGCTNNCRLTINRFTGGRQYISGNRCERGLGKAKVDNGIPNPNANPYLPSQPFSCKILVPQGSLSAYTSAANYPDPDIYTYEEYTEVE